LEGLGVPIAMRRDYGVLIANIYPLSNFMTKGQKVVCVDDRIEPDIRALYEAWIRKGTIYVIRDVVLAQNRKAEWGEVGLLLQGITNPTQSIPPFQERSFNSERFRPIEDRSLTREMESHIQQSVEA
jgi:hypothetical protein